MNDAFRFLRSAQELSALLDALPDAAVAVGEDDIVVAGNRAAQALFAGLRAGEPLFRFVRLPQVLGAVQNVRESGTPVRTTWLDRFPLERRFDVHVSAFDSPHHGRVVLLLFRDTTEGRRAERMRADFVANASHELRTPLASLIGFLDTLEGAARDDPVARDRFLRIMGQQARRMSRLIEDLLSLSRIEGSAHVQPRDIVDLSAIAAQTVDALARIADENGARLRLDAPQSVETKGDRDELLRVAENLVENAIKYGGQGTVSVRTARDGAWNVLDVQDEGPGIAPEHLPRLTERFYRVDAKDSRAKGGTGLGLSIVKHIVARHRGHLHITSRPGEGARFRVLLPAS